tara:strand:+ start:889 stop:1326 length:438 start_codon:yes stop_codon:yes gene_type:complete
MKFKPIKLGLIHIFMLFLFFIAVTPILFPLVEGLDSMGKKNAERAQQDEKTETMNDQSDMPNFTDEKWNDDNYMLKSQMVPPVCPACPAKCDTREKPCPPCPPCERCPEPAFSCKKVPNYDVNTKQVNDQYLPKPVLTDFSDFNH